MPCQIVTTDPVVPSANTALTGQTVCAAVATVEGMQIAHLSDTHLMTGPLAAGPAAALAQALGRLLALTPRPDCVVITGDLADTADADEYAMLHSILDRCLVPVHLTTGNHDLPEPLLAEFGGTRYLGSGKSTSYAVDYPDATIIVADSQLDGSPAGRLGAQQLAWIDEMLAKRPTTPAFICLHHPPLPIGIPFLDGMRLEDGADLGAVIASHANVARILAGHVHRAISAPFAGSLVTIAPSTYRQSVLRMHDSEPPGYLAEPTSFLLHLLDGPHCATHTVAVSHASAALAF
jgi:Icc protein